MGCLIILSVLVSVPGLLGDGGKLRQEGDVVDQDRERQPLLDDN